MNGGWLHPMNPCNATLYIYRTMCIPQSVMCHLLDTLSFLLMDGLANYKKSMNAENDELEEDAHGFLADNEATTHLLAVLLSDDDEM